MPWSKLADLTFTPKTVKEETHPLVVKPRRRTYLKSMDVVYDYHAGHEFVVVDPMSPYAGCVITTLDSATLRREGYTHLHIRYNTGTAPTIIDIRLPKDKGLW